MTTTERHEEYEIIPVSPIRRLERKIEQLEAMTPLDNREVFKEIISVIRMNQEIVNQLVKSTDDLKMELAKLPPKMDELIGNLNELISFIKSAGEEETIGITQEAMKPMVDKLDKLIEHNKKMDEVNESLLAVLDSLDKKLRRPVMHLLPPPAKAVPSMTKPGPRT